MCRSPLAVPYSRCFGLEADVLAEKAQKLVFPLQPGGNLRRVPGPNLRDPQFELMTVQLVGGQPGVDDLIRRPAQRAVVISLPRSSIMSGQQPRYRRVPSRPPLHPGRPGRISGSQIAERWFRAGVVDDGKAAFRDGPGDTCGEKGLSQTGPAAQKQVVDAGTAESMGIVPADLVDPTHLLAGGAPLGVRVQIADKRKKSKSSKVCSPKPGSGRAP